MTVLTDGGLTSKTLQAGVYSRRANNQDRGPNIKTQVNGCGSENMKHNNQNSTEIFGHDMPGVEVGQWHS